MIYLMSMRSNKGIDAIKIGFALDPIKRLRALQLASPHNIRLEATLPGDRKVEKKIQRIFRLHRIRGEWFKPSITLVKYIDGLRCVTSISSQSYTEKRGGRPSIGVQVDPQARQALKLAREAKRVSQESAARALGVSLSLFRAWEWGQRNPSPEHLSAWEAMVR